MAKIVILITWNFKECFGNLVCFFPMCSKSIFFKILLRKSYLECDSRPSTFICSLRISQTKSQKTLFSSLLLSDWSVIFKVKPRTDQWYCCIWDGAWVSVGVQSIRGFYCLLVINSSKLWRLFISTHTLVARVLAIWINIFQVSSLSLRFRNYF